MGFKKVDCVKELEDICKEDKDIVKYVKQFNEEYEDNTEIVRRLKEDDGTRYTSEDVIKMRKNRNLIE